MVRRHEDTITRNMCSVLQSMNSSITVNEQPLNIFPNTAKRPDLYLEDHGSAPVIIENEIEPGSPDKDAREKTELMIKHGFQPAVIGIQIPKRFRNMEQGEIIENLKKADDFKYVTYSPDRFPESTGRHPYLSGTLADISKVARTLSVPTKKIVACVDKLKEVIGETANQIDRSGPDTKREIASLIRQPATPQTWKIGKCFAF